LIELGYVNWSVFNYTSRATYHLYRASQRLLLCTFHWQAQRVTGLLMW